MTRKLICFQYACTECGKIFPRLFNLQRHMETHKQARVKYKCLVCQQYSINKHSHRVHWNRKHSNLPFQPGVEEAVDTEPNAHSTIVCNICEKSFARNENLRLHQRIHSHTRLKVQCDICKKTFSNIGNMRVHMKTHILTLGLKTNGVSMGSVSTKEKAGKTKKVKTDWRSVPIKVLPKASYERMKKDEIGKLNR